MKGRKQTRRPASPNREKSSNGSTEPFQPRHQNGVSLTAVSSRDGQANADSNGRQKRAKGVAEPPEAELVVYESQPAQKSYRVMGELLAKKCTDVYRDSSSEFGLVRIDNDGTPRRIADASTLMALIIDRTQSLLYVTAAGKLKARIPDAFLRDCLKTDIFLSCFRKLDLVTQTPFYLTDFSLTKPGYTDGGPHERILLIQNRKTKTTDLISRKTKYIDKFLSQMDFDCVASKTNLLGAALTVLFRFHWPGGKPVVLLTASKSHSGKDTCGRFAIGSVPYESVSYSATNWAFEMSLTTAIKGKPNLGCLVVENARLDGREKQIASACLERTLTEPYPFLFSSKGDTVKRVNNIVFFISTNFGLVSEDLLNRSLPVNLTPDGDVNGRPSSIGNPMHEFLPAHRSLIAAELRGMIETWKDARMPLDEDAKHPFAIWAKNIGGILKLHNYDSFLANYNTRASLDPRREALATLGAHCPNQLRRAGDWAALCHELGLTRTIIESGYQGTHKAREIGIGRVLSKHKNETFVATTEDYKLTLVLNKSRPRAGLPAGDQGKVHYQFKQLDQQHLID